MWICVLSQNWAEKYRDYPSLAAFKNFRFINVFCPHKNGKAAIPNSSGLKSVFENSVFVTTYRGRRA